MLIATFHNDNTGDEQIGNYDVEVFINYRKLYRGRIEGHERKDWRDLIIKWAYDLVLEKEKENEQQRQRIT
jgi:hypothetical protein